MTEDDRWIVAQPNSSALSNNITLLEFRRISHQAITVSRTIYMDYNATSLRIIKANDYKTDDKEKRRLDKEKARSELWCSLIRVSFDNSRADKYKITTNWELYLCYQGDGMFRSLQSQQFRDSIRNINGVRTQEYCTNITVHRVKQCLIAMIQEMKGVIILLVIYIGE